MSGGTGQTGKRPTLRAQLKDGWLLSAGCFDAWSAKLAEHVGFSSLHFSGGAFHTSQFAYAGLVYTMPEVASQVARITAAVDIPILADLDTGFGGVEDILRATRELERAGAGGIHIEDVPFPITRDGSGGTGVIPKNEAVGRVKAALAARTDPDFLVVGRTDSTISVDDLIERSNLFLAAGADVAFPLVRSVEVEGRRLSELPPPERLEWYRRIVREIDGPVVTVGGVDRTFSANQLRDVGFTWVIVPLVAFNAATAAMTHALREAVEDGRADQYFTEHPNPLKPAEYMKLIGYDRVAAHEREFGATASADESARPNGRAGQGES
ncbi:isocitrate lyase/PEP mutase family protein [Streptomyces sp. NPDC051985]|uniref:isocitrate lyase/PEP mutase family protein n=1 Tax=Streptomyces sp. NPDC051985 TaxID=3155807 RepID=UPI0034370A4F